MARDIALPELERLIADGAQLVEVLPEPDYAKAHLPGAINIPLKQLTPESAEQLDRDRPVVLYCFDSL
jgi:rhodanese-related sulfurtransferase